MATCATSPFMTGCVPIMDVVWEGGVQFLERLEGRHSLKNLEDRLFNGKLEAGSLVEISGRSGIGKSELLLNFVSRCLLPPKLGGLLVRTVYIDNDHHFSMLRLVSILGSRISATQEATDDHQSTIDSALKNLRIVRCTSGIHLLTTLHYLDSFTMNEEPFSLLIIDSLSAFYWEDRMIHGNLDGHHQRRIASILNRLTTNHKVTVLCTNQDLMKYRNRDDAGHSESFDELSSVLGRDLQKLRTFAIRLTRDCDSNSECNKVVAEVRHNKGFSRVCFLIKDTGIVFIT